MTAPLHASKEYVKHFFTTESVESRPTEWEIALHTGDPGTGDDNEVTSYDYQRVDVSFESYESGAFYEAQNTVDVAFAPADNGTEYTVTHYTIRDKVLDKALAVAQLAVPIQVSGGVPVIFPASYIKVRGV